MTTPTPETLDYIERLAKVAGDSARSNQSRRHYRKALQAQLDPATVLALVAECRELRRLRGALRVLQDEPEQAGKAQGWIPVEDRLPEKATWVLTCSTDERIGLAFWNDQDRGHPAHPYWAPMNSNPMPMHKVSHWMPLPEGPKR